MLHGCGIGYWCVVDSSRPRVGPPVSLERRRVLLTNLYGEILGQLRSFGLEKQVSLEINSTFT